MSVDRSSSSAHPIVSQPQSKPTTLALAILLLGGFITVFDLFAVNVAIPSMQADLGAGFAEIGFVIAGYELAFGVLLIAGGRLGDRHGRRRLFLSGMIGFAATSFLCGIAPDATSLIVARFLQGATGAILFPQVYALLRVLYGEADRRRAFGLLGMTLGLAAIARTRRVLKDSGDAQRSTEHQSRGIAFISYRRALSPERSASNQTSTSTPLAKPNPPQANAALTPLCVASW